MGSARTRRPASPGLMVQSRPFYCAGGVVLTGPRPDVLRVLQGLVPHRLDLEGIDIGEVLDMQFAPHLANRIRQVGQGDVLADARAEGDAAGVGAAAQRVDQRGTGCGVHHRAGSQGVTRHAGGVNIAGHGQVAEHGALVFALAEFQVRLFAVEIGGLHLGAGQSVLVIEVQRPALLAHIRAGYQW